MCRRDKISLNSMCTLQYIVEHPPEFRLSTRTTSDYRWVHCGEYLIRAVNRERIIFFLLLFCSRLSAKMTRFRTGENKINTIITSDGCTAITPLRVSRWISEPIHVRSCKSKYAVSTLSFGFYPCKSTLDRLAAVIIVVEYLGVANASNTGKHGRICSVSLFI